MENKIEFAMSLLAQMTVRELATELQKDDITMMSEFMQSRTAQMLYDKETGLWENGPDYIAEEYKFEIGLH